MATTILDLPTELLDRIYFYLDWDHSLSLTPCRPDIVNISLTCRRLRDVALPILFRDVTLKLRWVDGGLVEPAIVRIRRQRPHLFKHVRCVYIETLFGHFSDLKWRLKAFAVPGDLHDLLNPSSTLSDESSDAFHFRRVKDAIRSLFHDLNYPETRQDWPSELRDRADTLASQVFTIDELPVRVQMPTPEREVHDRTRGAKEQSRVGEDTFFDAVREEHVLITGHESEHNRKRDLRLRLDALIVVLLCFPPSVTSIVFQSQPTNPMDVLQHGLALNVIKQAMSIFGDRLQRLRLITTGLFGFPSQPTDPVRYSEQAIITAEAIGRLEVLQSLSLARQKKPRSYDNPSLDIARWQPLASRLAHLELWGLSYRPEDLSNLIQSFTNLQGLDLRAMELAGSDRRTALRGGYRRPTPTDWLALLIDIRRNMPQLSIQLNDIIGGEVAGGSAGAQGVLPASATRWLVEEAVPVGDTVTFERETRLLEDFPAFLPLWYAEDSERGTQAREERRDGRLVDKAMCSRC